MRTARAKETVIGHLARRHYLVRDLKRGALQSMLGASVYRVPMTIAPIRIFRAEVRHGGMPVSAEISKCMDIQSMQVLRTHQSHLSSI
jgi:hypothetical protein